MLFKLSTTHFPATDLGFLLHKHPDKLHTLGLSFGTAYIAYPHASDEKCEIALTVQLPFKKALSPDNEYVSEKAFTAASYLVSAIRKAFATAISGRSKERPELSDQPIPLEILITPVVSNSKTVTPSSLFEPLGWQVIDEEIPLDPDLPDFGCRHHRITLIGNHTVAQALRHVCVMLSVMNRDSHHYIGKDEIDKLNHLGEGWLDTHPQADIIRKKFLKYKELIDMAVSGPAIEPVVTPDEDPNPEFISLHQQRITTVRNILLSTNATSVVDLGCGEGNLLRELIGHSQFHKILAIDPSVHSLQKAMDRMHYRRKRELHARLTFAQGACTYPDARFRSYDAVAMIEVIEHLEPYNLRMFEEAVFGYSKPKVFVMTTPNREWNEIFGPDRKTFRHRDHRFEWSRDEFDKWCNHILADYGYSKVEKFIIGDEIDDLGAPTQGATFFL